MAVYTVHEAPPKAADASPDPERFVFVRDGFYFWAFLLTPLWMLRYRMWAVFACYLVAVSILQVILAAAHASAAVQAFAGLLVAFLAGCEAATLRRWTLTRRKFTQVGLVVGDDLEMAEQRFFELMGAKRPGCSGLAAAPRDNAAPASGSRQRCDRPVPGARSVAVTVAIVDYGSGNLHSAAKAFERAARESGHDQPIEVTSDPDRVARADRVVLPGVGAFADCRHGLDAIPGMVDALNTRVRKEARPFLGICVGMQLMAERGREYEVTEGLGWIPGEVDRIAPVDPGLKIPHMGWNTLNERKPHPLLDGIAIGPDGLHAYFVHSYHLKPAQRSDLVAEADYGGPVTAIVGRDTMVGTQFHPEKSQRLGLKLIANFLKWAP